jgi:hypothetical protein
VNTIKVNIFAVCENDEILIGKDVELSFPMGVATFPMPKVGACEEALRMQHNEIYRRIPVVTRGFIMKDVPLEFRLGLRFERVNEE